MLLLKEVTTSTYRYDADALESENEEIDCIARDLEFLKQNGRDVILQALEMIALENESIPEKWNNKGYKRTLSL